MDIRLQLDRFDTIVKRLAQAVLLLTPLRVIADLGGTRSTEGIQCRDILRRNNVERARRAVGSNSSGLLNRAEGREAGGG